MPVSRFGAPVRSLGLACVVTLGPAGCADSADAPAFTVADSAGITIVTNHGPRWDADEGWRLSPEPSLRIGMLEGDPVYQFAGVLGARRLTDGRIAVLDETSGELRFFDPAGKFVKRSGGHGSGPGEFNRPVGLIRQAGDTLLVSGYHSLEASWFTSEGTFVRSARLTGDPYRLGNVWGCPMRTDLLPDGSYLVCVGSLPDRRQHPEAGRAAHFLVRVPYDVSWADTLGTAYGGAFTLGFGAPGTALAAGGDPLRIFMGDPAHFEIDVAGDRTGRMMSIRYPQGLRAVTEGDKQAYIARAEEARKSPPPSPPSGEPVSWGPMPEIFAETFPGFADLIYDEAGFIWAIQPRRGPENEPAALVFATSGELLGSVPLPDAFTIHEIGQDYVLGVSRDDLDVEYVTLYDLGRE